MKNKNNVNNIEVHQLVNAVVELCEKKGNSTYAHSYALGTLQSIIHGVTAGWEKNLQSALNDSYNNIQNELKALDKGVHVLQTA